MVAAAAPMVVNYKADVVYPSGEKFYFEGSFPIAQGSDANVLTAAQISTATAAIAADITAKISVGTPQVPVLTTRQSIARGRT
jgi:hypothetical protein